jgi:hypothetical protein
MLHTILYSIDQQTNHQKTAMKPHDIFIIISISGMCDTNESNSQPARMGMSSIRPLPFTISYAKKEEIHNLQNITSPPPVI